MRHEPKGNKMTDEKPKETARIEANTKTVCVEIHREQEHLFNSKNGIYNLKIPQGSISYFDDYYGKVNRDSVGVQARGGEFYKSLCSRHIANVQVPESLIEQILNEWKNVVFPSFSKLLSLYQESDNARKRLISCPAVIQPILLLSSEARAQIDGPLNELKKVNGQLEQSGRSREFFYRFVQKLHDEYIKPNTPKPEGG
jgi:hypothetical protein